MLLKRKETLPVSDLLVLLSWLQSETILGGNKKFQFDHLLKECRNSTEVDVEGFLDDLMYDSYKIYKKIKELDPKEMEKKVHMSPLFKILPKDIVEESKRGMKSYIDLYERLMMETKFEYSNIREIQRTMLSILQTQYIVAEEHEKCSELKQKLEEI